jgi:hypothetical protein
MKTENHSSFLKCKAHYHYLKSPYCAIEQYFLLLSNYKSVSFDQPLPISLCPPALSLASGNHHSTLCEINFFRFHLGVRDCAICLRPPYWNCSFPTHSSFWIYFSLGHSPPMYFSYLSHWIVCLCLSSTSLSCPQLEHAFCYRLDLKCPLKSHVLKACSQPIVLLGGRGTFRKWDW